ncbi:alpha-glucuronidase family glycosyl hydrolase [Terriglobus sp. 2YAB30_2]|uniref:alpha-glucuronidase family glycosyl hydrolase n=1 Tax=Terriglobus sp. 2YAB30_2 TaxID=3233023 RepID=UPI003F97F9F5
MILKRHHLQPVSLFASMIALSSLQPMHAEDGSAAWLRYAPVATAQYRAVPTRIVPSSDSSIEHAAAEELQRGLNSMLGVHAEIAAQSASAQRGAVIRLVLTPGTSPEALDSYTIDASASGIRIAANTPQAELYGVFHLLELIGSEQLLPKHEQQTAAAGIRWTDEWDNMNGTIERGYAGASIFFENGHVREDLTRAGQYARLLASIGINGCNVNNVNADLDLLTPAHIREFARLAEVFRPWGVRLAMSIDLTSPQTVGGMSTFDPLDPSVATWWKEKVDEIYRAIPDFGGFTVKADSEGRKGPSQYGRSPADAANVLARALAPHHGVVLYRGFVYNNHLDWQDHKADRARAGVDNFARYDGTFEDNVIIQIKEGPIDFQAREPVSPLFAALRRANVAIELQTAQEYTGQQRHMVWLPNMWHWVLDTDLHADDRSTPVKQIVTGHSFPLANGKPRRGGFVSVTNVGMEANWLHHPMAMANLYGFGKLAWNPDQLPDQIIDRWARLTWGNRPEVVKLITTLQLESWQVYEGYTGPNGIGTLTNILGYHFGPGIESAERNGWGQWFRGEKDGIGMDRTANGTGYIQQYPPQLAAKYESLATCPEDLLLFFHHVPYDYKLRNGKTLVQSIYDTHYSASAQAGTYVTRWQQLHGMVDDERYEQVLRLFRFQAGHAIVWRDAINNWFQRISQIPDAQGRVGHDAGRVEAEAVIGSGYEPVDVTPWETASGGKAVVCHKAEGCTLAYTFQQSSGTYDIAVQYFDIWRGVSRYELQRNGEAIASWQADDTLPPAQFDANPDGQTSTRFTANRITLQQGDKLELHAIPDLRSELQPGAAHKAAPGELESQSRIPRDYREYAPVDYIEVTPSVRNIK